MQMLDHFNNILKLSKLFTPLLKLRQTPYVRSQSKVRSCYATVLLLHTDIVNHHMAHQWYITPAKVKLQTEPRSISTKAMHYHNSWTSAVKDEARR
jgi:hypothetical protein